MSQEKHFTAGRLAGWSVGIALLQFIVFFVSFKATGRIEDAAFAVMLTALIAVFAALIAVFAALAATSLAVFDVAYAALIAGFAATLATPLATSTIAFAAPFAVFAASDARKAGARGNFLFLSYIALPLGIAGAIIALTKTGSWGVALGILLADVVMKVVVARWAEGKPTPAAA